MIGPVTARDALVVMAFGPAFRRSDAREVGRRVRDGAASGARAFVVDLTRATVISEAHLVLALLGLRSELERRSARLVVAAERPLARRIGTSLRFDAVLGAASSREQAIGLALDPPPPRRQSPGSL